MRLSGIRIHYLLHRPRMPLSTPSLRWNFERVENIGDFPVAESLASQGAHLFDVRGFSLVLDLKALHHPSAISKLTTLGNADSCLSYGDAMQLEILQNGGSGGKNLGGDFLARKPFYDVFLLEETIVLKERCVTKFNGIKEFQWRKHQVG